MKKIFYILTLAAAVLSCTRTIEGIGEGYENGVGRLSLDVSSNDAYNAKSGSNTNVSDLVVTITRSDNRYTTTYDRFGDMPQIVELGSGDYTINVVSPNIADAEWDLPIFEGSANFTIRTGELTPVSIVCAISNMKVSFVLSDNFKNELSNYTVTVTNAASWDAADVAEKTLLWDKDKLLAGDAGYFSVAPLLIKVWGYRAIDNTETSFDKVISGVAAKQHHIITLDAQVTGQLGGENGGIQITLDDSVNEVTTNVDIPGFDEVPVEGGEQGGEDPEDPQDPGQGGGQDPQPSNAPTMSWAANPNFDPMTITDPMDVNIQIEAPQGIKSFIVNVNSSVLGGTIAALGATDHGDGTVDMDMINNEDLCDELDGMGLGIPTRDALKDQTSVLFSLSNLIPMINMYAPPAGTQHVFTLTVVDNDDQSLVKPITFVSE